MSDFFAGLGSGNIRFTDAKINQGGPLPGEPYASVDGRYNFNSELLSGIDSYAGPKQGSMGSDRNYQQIPHRKQMVVPPLFLPESYARTQSVLKVAHPVDMGDLVFVICLRKSFVVMTDVSQWIENSKDRMVRYSTVFPLCNVCTANYIMLGLQNAIVDYCDSDDLNGNLDLKLPWHRLLHEFGVSMFVKGLKAYRRLTRHISPWSADCVIQLGSIMQYIFQHGFRPFGIAAGSEKQGGLHETGLAPVQAAASHYTTLTVDGQNRDLVNIWQGVDVQAGDNLILKCEFVENDMDNNYLYTLNHYYKERQTRELTPVDQISGRWQIVPDAYKQCYDPEYIVAHCGNACGFRRSVLATDSLKGLIKLSGDWQARVADRRDLTEQQKSLAETELENRVSSLIDYRTAGYWRIAQAFTKHKGGQYNAGILPINDMQYTLGHLLLQVTFAPVFICNNTAGSYTELLPRHRTTDDVTTLIEKAREMIDASVRVSLDSTGGAIVERPPEFREFGEATALKGLSMPTAVSMDRKRTLDGASQANSGASSTLLPISEQPVQPPAKTSKKKKESVLKVTYGTLSESTQDANKDK